jgi:hypothetical protein
MSEYFIASSAVYTGRNIFFATESRTEEEMCLLPHRDPHRMFATTGTGKLNRVCSGKPASVLPTLTTRLHEETETQLMSLHQ